MTGVIKKYSKTCQDTKSELAAIVNSSYDGIFITDSEGNVLRFNKAYERITGIEFKDAVGKNMYNLVQEGMYDQSVTLLVIQTKKTETINQVIKRTNKTVLVTGNPIFDQQGNLFRVVTNVRDVTDLVNLQNQLSASKEQSRKYKAELEHLRSMHTQHADIIYRSQAVAHVIELATKVADVDSNVLITGESGTGKELIAKLIHKAGKGSKKPFIKINCGAIPEQLLESELFGYEAGAFTGAKKEGKPGMFELANDGTLFLDEIGDLPAVLQVKLLRAIQEKEVMRVGGLKPIKVNVRIVTATHRDLLSMVKNKQFREDLYYRLMVVPIKIPPLRERREDVPLLVMHFLDKFNSKFNFNKYLAPSVIDSFMEYSWPGNVREMQNVIERMVVTSVEDELSEHYLPDTIYKKTAYIPAKTAKLKEAMDETEAYLIRQAHLKYGSWQKVAIELGVDRTTIFRKAAKYGLIE